MSSLPSQNSEEQPGLLKTLAAVFSGVLFGLFLSKFNTPTEDSRESVHPKDSPRPETGLSPSQISVTAQIPPTPTHHYTPDRRKDNTPPWKKRAEIIALCIAGGLLLGNIVVSCANWRAANAAKEAARIADATLKSSNLSAWRDQRAWIVFTSSPTVTFKGPIKMDVTIDNLGKTEAKKLNGVIGIKVVKKGEVPDLAEKSFKTQLEVNVLVPKFHKTIPIGAYKKDSRGERQDLLAADISSGMVDGSLSMLIYGHFTYVDAWKVSHWIRFCDSVGAYNPGTNNPCADYNDTDENEPK